MTHAPLPPYEPQFQSQKQRRGPLVVVGVLTLDQQGTKLFGRLTTDLATKQPPANQLAVVVGNEVVTAPTVSSAITAGKIQISGNFTQSQVEALAAKITG